MQPPFSDSSAPHARVRDPLRAIQELCWANVRLFTGGINRSKGFQEPGSVPFALQSPAIELANPYFSLNHQHRNFKPWRW